MANVLDLLWDLVERPHERAEYLEDPPGYVRARGRGDLTGEDVKTALDLVRDLVPADLAAAISSPMKAAPPLAAHGDESPFDGALRSLSHVVDSVDGLAEAGPRPDPQDLTAAPSPADAPPSAVSEPVAEDTSANDAGVDDNAAEHAFDPSALRVEVDSPPGHDTLEPVPAMADEPPFDPNAILTEDDDAEADGTDMADVVTLSWDEDPRPPPPESSSDRTDEGAFAFGPGPATPPADDPGDSADLQPAAPSGFGTGGADQEAEATDEEAETESLVSPSETALFKKKSKLTLPTLGIDASDWYAEDDPDED